MKVNADNIPFEMEFLQDGILVRSNVTEETKEERITYNYDEVKIELNDDIENIRVKLVELNSTDKTLLDKVKNFRDEFVK
jgi:hypothetical protein